MKYFYFLVDDDFLYKVLANNRNLALEKLQRHIGKPWDHRIKDLTIQEVREI